MSASDRSTPNTHHPSLITPVLYVDCFSGVSGDMLLGAMLDVGLPLERLRHELASLPLAGYRLEAQPRTSHGVSGTKLDVVLEEREQPERHLAEIVGLIERSGVSAGAQGMAIRIFERLGRAESKIHGVPIDQVHFHEVGAVDSIVDILGVSIGLEALGVDQVYASSLPLAHGTIRTRHGLLPLPAPATMELIAECGAPTRPAPGHYELVTPTGAAILAEVAEWTQPSMQVRKLGYGFGTKEMEWPNAVRLWLGEIVPGSAAILAASAYSTPGRQDGGAPGFMRDQVVVIETNLDDSPPELLGYAMERLFEAGALDVYFTPIQMKKNRPGSLLGVIAPPDLVESLAELILTETTSLGVRFQPMDRLIVERRAETVMTPLGPVRVKLKRLGERWIASPEYEDCARLARELGLPLLEVFRTAQAAGQAHSGPP